VLFSSLSVGPTNRRSTAQQYQLLYIQGTQKRTVKFQKLTRNLFLTLHGHNVHHQQQQLSKFLMLYQQFASHAYCGAVRFRKDAPARCVFSKPCTKLTLHCNHRSGHLKTEYTESIFLLQHHLGNWPRGPEVSLRSELLVANEKFGQLRLLTVWFVPV